MCHSYLFRNAYLLSQYLLIIVNSIIAFIYVPGSGTAGLNITSVNFKHCFSYLAFLSFTQCCRLKIHCILVTGWDIKCRPRSRALHASRRFMPFDRQISSGTTIHFSQSHLHPKNYFHWIRATIAENFSG